MFFQFFEKEKKEEFEKKGLINTVEFISKIPTNLSLPIPEPPQQRYTVTGPPTSTQQQQQQPGKEPAIQVSNSSLFGNTSILTKPDIVTSLFPEEEALIETYYQKVQKTFSKLGENKNCA